MWIKNHVIVNCFGIQADHYVPGLPQLFGEVSAQQLRSGLFRMQIKELCLPLGLGDAEMEQRAPYPQGHAAVMRYTVPPERHSPRCMR